MIKLIDSLSNFKNTNLVFLLESDSDIDEIKSKLELDNKYLSKIREIIKLGENSVFDFFYWVNEIEKVYIIFFIDRDKKTLIEYVWWEISKLPNKFTLIINKKENTKTLLDLSILSRYKFSKYKKEEKTDDINILYEDKETKSILEKRIKTLENIVKCRDLVNTPTCDKTPEKIVDIIKNLNLKNTNIKILNHSEIKNKWLNLIDSVGKWSINKPYLVILEKIIDKKLPTIWLVGKWVVFDTGWINLKWESWLYMMKDDMWWAATTIYTMKELDDKNLNVNIIASIPLVENSISGDAYRPSDIIKAYNWKTVDIINTDAEGRLILADAMSYISDKYKLSKIISIATLTWSCLYALGYKYAGIMWNDRQVIDRLLSYSEENWEKYWELPYDDYFINKTKWDISDLKNLSEWIYAGSSMWWAFLSNFCDNNEKYTHIDIAWVVSQKENYGIYTKDATWFWVDSLAYLFSNL